MTKVEFLFDFGSPNAYLAHKVIPGIEKRTGATFTYVPILLGGIFKETGNRSPVEAFAGIRNKLDYQKLEMKRFIERYGLTKFAMNPHFPVNTLGLMRGAIAAQKLEVFERYAEAMFAAMWEDGLKMDDPQVIVDTLRKADIDGNRLMAMTQKPDIKAALADNTAKAVTRGAFGSPTFFVGGDIYFGKDRLGEVEDAIVAAQS